MRALRTLAPLVALVVLLAGCATAWTARTSAPAVAPQWPPSPRPAKLVFERTLSGFERPGRLGARLGALATGQRAADRDAFVLPVAVATGPGGRIGVADAGRRCVHLFLPDTGRYLQLTGPRADPLVSPAGLAFGSDSRLFVTDSTGALYGFGPAGESLFVQRRAGAEALARPSGVAYDPRHGRLYVVDTALHRVDAFRSDGAFEFSFGARGSEPGAFNYPTQIAWAAGELYVADSLNFRVQIFDEAGTPSGAFGHHGDGSGDLALPKGVAVDRSGVVYVVDGLFDNVQLFDRRGAFLLTLGSRGAGFGEFWLPMGAFISEQGELYVCDSYNRRVQVFRIAENYAPATS